MNELKINSTPINPDTNITINDIKLYLKIRIILSLIFIVILLLLCYFINGLTDEINSLTREILHFNYHNYGCCQFYN